MCAIIFIVVAAVIIPRWRITELESEPPTLSSVVSLPLVLTLVLVVVLLLDHACTLLCARWRRFTQVISCCILCRNRFLALVEVVGKTRPGRFICQVVKV